MHRMIISAVLAVSLGGCTSGWAQDCGPLKPQRTIDTEVRRETEANASVLVKSLGQGTIRNEYQRIEKNQQFSNADDTHLWNSFIYMLCTFLESSDLSDNDRLVQYFKLVELSRQSPPAKPPISQPAAPTTPFPPSTAANVLYETGIGKGQFEGWGLTPGWVRYRGKLLNDGSAEDKGFAPSMAPYEPADEDYAIEAEIRVIEDSTRHGDSFGLIARAGDQNGYAVGVADDASGRICYLSAWTGVGYVGGGNGIRDDTRCKPKQAFTPGGEWRRYRLELRGNSITLRIDDAIITRATDNKFLTGGGVGLWSVGYQLEVRQFKVVKL